MGVILDLATVNEGEKEGIWCVRDILKVARRNEIVKGRNEGKRRKSNEKIFKKRNFLNETFLERIVV